MVWQQIEIRSLRSDLSRLTNADNASSTAPISAPAIPNVPAAVFNPDSGPMRQQLSALEEKVQKLTLELTLASELLMERGALPISEAKAAASKRTFLDTSLPDQERLRALRILKRGDAIDEEVLQAGLSWIQTLVDPKLLGEALEQFVELQSPALRNTALQLVTTHPDEYVRRRAAQILRGLKSSTVESEIWTALASEQSRDVQRELEDALRDIPVNSTRKAELEGRVLNSGASFSERFTAFRVLISANVASAQAVAAFANEVVAQSNPERMADLFRTLDNTGNLAAAPALINGLQVGDPGLRVRALDALGEMQVDPTVVKWLQHTANNDADERVRAEAVRVLAQGGNRPR
jgi:hypothetical protein